MPIDFHSATNRNTYAGRDAHPDWTRTIRQIVDPAGKRVADGGGGGGGIYTAAWASLGAAHVTGVDFSAQMVRDASEANREHANVAIRRGSATDTGLPDASVDIVFERALIHHLPDRAAGCREACRILTPGGGFIVQDRTPEDVAIPGTPEHIRGYFFELFPRLSEIEAGRRPGRKTVEQELRDACFVDLQTHSLWETRKLHPDATALARDLMARTGRSILHDLSDDELAKLTSHIVKHVPQTGPVAERDRWTIWTGRKPA